MHVFISDLSGATIMVDTHIVPQTALYTKIFFNRVRDSIGLREPYKKLFKFDACTYSYIRV